MTLRRADRAYVLDRGRVVLAGTADEIASSTTITHAYLGVTAGSPAT